MLYLEVLNLASNHISFDSQELKNTIYNVEVTKSIGY